jgi:hypothetical protein
MQHPINELSIEDGKLFQSLASDPSTRNSYMEIPEISIIEKIEYQELANDEAEFSFRLNHYTCPIWRQLFKEHFEFPVEIEGQVLRFSCLPVELEGQYKRVKGAIEQTNTVYREERVQLIAIVQEQEKSHLVEEKQHEARLKTLKETFEELKL